jgi:hypothetical protein
MPLASALRSVRPDNVANWKDERNDRPHPADPGAPVAPASGGPAALAALGLLCLAQFMVILDVTVVNVALPSIGADLHLDRSSLPWVVTAYRLCFGGLMLLGGRLPDTLGRRLFLAGLGLFTAAPRADRDRCYPGVHGEAGLRAEPGHAGGFGDQLGRDRRPAAGQAEQRWASRATCWRSCRSS